MGYLGIELAKLSYSGHCACKFTWQCHSYLQLLHVPDQTIQCMRASSHTQSLLATVIVGVLPHLAAVLNYKNKITTNAMPLPLKSST
jgi:hypothetical protein